MTMPAKHWPRSRLCRKIWQGKKRRRIVSRQGVSARRDRKSTRLNSSHSQISYAVFCLKKIDVGDSAPNHVKKSLCVLSLSIALCLFFVHLHRCCVNRGIPRQQLVSERRRRCLGSYLQSSK